MEQGNDIPSVIEEVFKRYTDGSYIKASMLPDLDLYVDQITTFLTRHLAKTIRFEDDKIMTKTMINNYTKNHLLPPPDKKKYSKDHVLTLILIYYLKSFLSIKDIQTLLEPITDKYFGTESELSFYELYEELVAQGNGQSKALIKDVIAKYNAMQNAFSDAPEEDQEFLRNFGFICMLSFDVYIKKMMIETLIDFNSQQRKEAADQAKEKKDKS